MGADEYLVHRHRDTIMPKDKLDVWRAVTAHDQPSIQIDQSNGVTASVNYTTEEAVALAQAILTAAGLNITIPTP